MKKVLITGACGHIGSRLLMDLGQNYDLILLDNLSTQRYASLFGLGDDARFILGDVCQPDWKTWLKGVYAVVHLAAATDAAESHKDEEKYMTTNYVATQRLADACAEMGVKLFFPSTTSVYGSQDSVVDETCTELKPQSPYAESKLAAEEYIRGIKGLQYVIARFGTIYGWSMGMRFHTAVNLFLWQAITNQPITIWKTAMDQKRPYLYLGDACRFIEHCLQTKFWNGETYNVVTGNHTPAEILKVLEKELGKLNIKQVDSPIMNQLSYEVTGDKAASFGFVPYGELRVGIEETLFRLWHTNQ